MRKVIAGINMTLDGFCDHTAIDPDEEIHQHYTTLLANSSIILYGRITYQLMQYWKPFLNNPSGEKSMDDFAVAIDAIPKIVFSNTLEDVDWDTASHAKDTPGEIVTALKQQAGKDILVGSRSIILQLMQLNLIDEYQFCVHPVIAGKGLKLFENMNEQISLKLVKTKLFGSGAVILYYRRI